MVPEDAIDEEDLQQALEQGAVIRTDYSSRIIYTVLNDEITIFANGQLLDDINDSEASLLKRLADAESLTLEDLTQANVATITVLSWFENSWVWLDF